MTDGEDPYSREALIASGWQQLSLLPEGTELPHVAWIHHEHRGSTKARRAANAQLQERGELHEPFVHDRPPGDGDRLVVVTQRCDLVKTPNDFPFVEVAKASWSDNDRTLDAAARKTSAVQFLLTERGRAPGLVLDARFRVHLEKGFLAAHQPDNSILDAMPPARRRDFEIWMGLRYSRPTVPEQDMATIVGPIRAGWVDLDDVVAARWRDRFAELRYVHTGGELKLIAVTFEPVGQDDIDGLELLDWMREQVAEHHPDPDLRLTSYFDMTRAEELASTEIDLHWVSFEEEVDPDA